MNLITGESHVWYIFNQKHDYLIDEKAHYARNQDFCGVFYPGGLTIISVTKNMEELLQKVDISGCENIIYMYGTNDAILRRDNRLYPKDYIGDYISSIENVRSKYGFKNAYVTCPFYVGDWSKFLATWDSLDGRFNSIGFSNSIVDLIGDEIIKETSKYENVHSVDLRDLYTNETEDFAAELTFDGLHFNELGKQMFFDRLYETIRKQSTEIL